MHNLQWWLEDEVSIKKKESKPQMPRNLTNTPTQQNTGAKSKVLEKAKDKLNIRYERVQTTKDKNTKNG